MADCSGTPWRRRPAVVGAPGAASVVDPAGGDPDDRAPDSAAGATGCTQSAIGGDAGTDTRTGKEVWRTPRTVQPARKTGWSTPFVWEHRQRTELITLGPGVAISYGLDGKEVIALEEMEQKLRAALATRTDPDFCIIARTDARGVHGFDDAIARGRTFASLGVDAVFVEAPQAGRKVAKGESVGVVESVKAASDIYAPIAGEVVAVNADLSAAPEKVNADAYAAWMYRIKPSNPSDLDAMLDAAAYEKVAAE